MVRGLTESMANTHSLKEIESIQESLRRDTGPTIELHQISGTEFLKLCEQIRVLWVDLSKNAGKSYRPIHHHILEKWWNHYSLSDAKYWIVSYETRTFFPRETNFRALIATVLFENRAHMKTCANCDRYFFGRRHDSKYCMMPECQRAYGAARAKKLQANKARRPN